MQASQQEVEAFFTGLGITALDDDDFDDALAGLPGLGRHGGTAARFRTIEDLLAYQYSRADVIRLLIGRDFGPITFAAALLSDLPTPKVNATILDIGGGPGHLALWMKHRWPSVAVTVLDPAVSGVDRNWAPGASDIRFVTGRLWDSMEGLDGERFDRVVLARTLGQGGSARADLKATCRRAMREVFPLVAPGGDLAMIDHFHKKNSSIAECIAAAGKKAGFNDRVKGWKAPSGTCLPFQLRFVNGAIVD